MAGGDEPGAVDSIARAQIRQVAEDHRATVTGLARLEEREEQHWHAAQKAMDSLHSSIEKTNDKLDAEIKAVHQRIDKDHDDTSEYRQGQAKKDGKLAMLGVVGWAAILTVGSILAAMAGRLFDWITKITGGAG